MKKENGERDGYQICLVTKLLKIKVKKCIKEILFSFAFLSYQVDADFS